MDADAFRHLYEYHFSENRKIWNSYVTKLSYEQFIRPVNYSHGSVRDQLVHIMNVDDAWFSELRGIENPQSYTHANVDDRNAIHAHWNIVEQNMRDYLGKLQDDMLFAKPIKEPEEDKDLILWQVLLHVVNHGTDHRAQLLRSLNDFGVETGPQDYMFYVYDHLQK